jgi:pimeloyl-ACP methyl ester carboxylesterase
VHNVPCDEEGGWIHTVEVGNPKNLKLVFLHGFGGSACCNYVIFKELVKHFHVIAIDTPGSAGSYRHKWTAKTV